MHAAPVISVYLCSLPNHKYLQMPHPLLTVCKSGNTMICLSWKIQLAELYSVECLLANSLLPATGKRGSGVALGRKYWFGFVVEVDIVSCAIQEQIEAPLEGLC
jgi:hypothetical protein